jgi:putative drug exporter of the RND superfamily
VTKSGVNISPIGYVSAVENRKGRQVLQWIARLAIAAPRRVIAVAALGMVAAAIFGVPVAKSLSASGFADPHSESAKATQLLAERFGQGDVQLLIIVSSPEGVSSAPARAVGTDIVDQLRRSPHVASVTSAWTAPGPAAAGLVSRDGTAGLIVAGITGGESNEQAYAKTLAQQLAHDRDGVSVRAGGTAMVNAEITDQLQRDLLVMESIALPLSFLVLIWVFGGLLAAGLPIAVGAMAIVGTMAVLRAITAVTDVSILALNLSTAMGMALAIDYTLLMISRYRDELAGGATREDALVRTMASTGRTVVFSATTVALSMAVMVFFPMHILRSFAYAGVATVALAAAAALVITPAALALLGPRLDGLDVRGLLRRARGRHAAVRGGVEQLFWYRWTTVVMRHAVVIAAAAVALLVVVGMPFTGVRWGFPDDRVLPATASARQVGDQLRSEFADDFATALTIVIPHTDQVSASELDRYAAQLSQLPDVSAVSAPTGTFVAGTRTGAPSAPTGAAHGSAFLTLNSSAPLFSARSQAQLDDIHAVPGPAGAPVEITGTAAINHDSVTAITSRLPLVLGLIAIITLALLFLLTGSIVLPLKAVALNVLSLTAAFGAIVWIFQDGHLGAFGTTATGTLVANMPVLLFCIAFGLSMDYEVFLVSRIREFWLASARTPTDNDQSVALGVAHTARVITAAALIMSISFAALIAAHVSFMRMFGVGLTLAILTDATLVRMVLVPAFMHVLGQWNWWAPKPLAQLHHRLGFNDGQPDRQSEGTLRPGRHAKPTTASVIDTA